MHLPHWVEPRLVRGSILIDTVDDKDLSDIQGFDDIGKSHRHS